MLALLQVDPVHTGHCPQGGQLRHGDRAVGILCVRRSACPHHAHAYTRVACATRAKCVRGRWSHVQIRGVAESGVEVGQQAGQIQQGQVRIKRAGAARQRLKHRNVRQGLCKQRLQRFGALQWQLQALLL